MPVKIRPITLKDAASYRRCWDAVAKERRYTTEFMAPPLSHVRSLLRRDVRRKTPHLVAMDGDRVVGWAAILPFDLPTLSHNARFGIGLLPEYREAGLGTKLMAGVLKLARGKYHFVYLEVFGKNKRAQKLYKKTGFELCGRIKKSVKGLTYGYDDSLLMQKKMRR